MSAQVFWNESRRRYMVALTLDADEAENVGHALGIRDAGGRDLIDCAHKAQDLNREIRLRPARWARRAES